MLVDSSPAAIITTSSNGCVLLANDAADRLFGLEPGKLPGRPIREFLPSLINVPAWTAAGRLFAQRCNVADAKQTARCSRPTFGFPPT